MIQYANTDLRPAIFKLWDSLGVSWKHTKYLSEQFATLMDFYLMVAEYYGIDGGVRGLIDHIINEGNQILSNPDNQECMGSTIRMYNIDLEPEMFSRQTMYGFYNGYGSKPYMSFAFDLVDPDSFECPDIPGYPKEDMYRDFEYRNPDFDLKNMTKQDEENFKEFCFEESCLRDMIDKVSSHVRKKYGISCNINVSHEREMLGNIRKSKW